MLSKSAAKGLERAQVYGMSNKPEDWEKARVIRTSIDYHYGKKQRQEKKAKIAAKYGLKKEESDYKSRDKIMKRAKPLHKHLFKSLHKKDTSGDVNESRYDRYDAESKKFTKADRKMKFGKFYDKAKEARDRLRPGEVKRYDKKLGRYVSNKD